MRSEGYSFFVWSGNNLILSLMLFTSCFSGQVCRRSGGIAVDITCIECACVRVHVESKDSSDGGITVAIVSVSRLETSVSMGPWVTTAPFRALMSRCDSLLREAPSFMSSWMSLRHNEQFVAQSDVLHEFMNGIETQCVYIITTVQWFGRDLCVWCGFNPLMKGFCAFIMKPLICWASREKHSMCGVVNYTLDGQLAILDLKRSIWSVSYLAVFYERICWCWFYQLF